MLYQIVVFMIECGSELFTIPAGLAADIRLYWHEKEKKKLSSRNNVCIVMNIQILTLSAGFRKPSISLDLKNILRIPMYNFSLVIFQML